MRNLLAALVGKRAVIILISTLIILDLILITSFFSKSIQTIISKSPFFEILTLTVLAEILVFLSSSLWRTAPIPYGAENEAQEKIIKLKQ